MTIPNVKALIVDDEPDARQAIKILLEKHPNIQVVAEAGNADEAIKAIMQKQPELIFLDIDLPGKNGLELAQEIRAMQLNSTIIFITAFNSHAIAAFKVAAMDYLMKPLIPDDLDQALTRFYQNRYTQNLNKKLELLSSYLEQQPIKFNTHDGFIMLNPDDIFYCEADGNYTHIYTTNGEKQLVTQQMGKLMEQLDDARFLRINRSVIVNRKFINSYKRCDRQLNIAHQLLFQSFKVSREVAREL